MKACLSPILLGGCALIGALTGCTNPGTAMLEPDASFAVKTPNKFATVGERERYIDANYQFQLNTGRAKNEDEARALASMEWERVRFQK